MLGFESRIAVGPTMAYEASDPLGNKSVGHGLHELRFHTTVSRRFTYVDPWFGLYYQLPFARTDSSLLEQTSRIRGKSTAARSIGPGWT